MPVTNCEAALTRPVQTKRKARGEGHERRDEILNAAERIFVELGYEGATIRKIAEAVGLSSTALYLHFPDKAAILREICVKRLNTMAEASARIAEMPGTPMDHLRAHLDAYVEFGLTNPNAYRLIYMTRPLEADEGGVQMTAQELGAGVFSTFERAVAQLAEEGRLTTDYRTASQVLWAGAHGVIALVITKTYFDWVEPRKLAATTLDALLRGLLRS